MPHTYSNKLPIEQIRQILSDKDNDGPHRILSITQYYNHHYVVLTTNEKTSRGWLMIKNMKGDLFLSQMFDYWEVDQV